MMMISLNLRLRFCGAMLWTLVFVFFMNLASAQKTSVKDDYASAITKFRQEKESDLRKPDGWLSLVALAWLPEGTSDIYLTREGSISLQSPSEAARKGGTAMATMELNAGNIFLHNIFIDGLRLNGSPRPMNFRPIESSL